MNDVSDSANSRSDQRENPEVKSEKPTKKKLLFAFDSPQELQRTLPLSIDLASIVKANLSNMLIHDDELLQACDLPSSREVLSNLGRSRPFTLSQFKRDVDRQIIQMRKQIDLLCRQYSIPWDFQEQQSPLIDYMQSVPDTDVIVLSRCSWKRHLLPQRNLGFGRSRYAPFGFVYDGSEKSEKAFLRVLYFCEQLNTDLVVFVPNMAAKQVDEMVRRTTAVVGVELTRRIFLVDLDHDIETGNLARIVNTQPFSALFLPLDEWVLETLKLQELERQLKVPLVLLKGN